MQQQRILIVLILIVSIYKNTFSQSSKNYINSDSSSWYVTPQIEVGSDSLAMLKAGYNVTNWVPAVVPGTVFNSYVTAGLEQNPDYGDNIYKVDRKKYDQSFWYRLEFTIPDNYSKDVIWLNFEGINRSGDIYLNGKKLGKLSGMMQRGKFDITSIANRKGSNVLAVLVSIPELPLNNYGSPTYIASAGWDWIPYVPGLNSGITDDVYLSNTGKLTIEDPWIRTDLPTNARADLSASLEVRNSTKTYMQGEINGVIQPGNIAFTKRVGVEAGRKTMISFDKEQFPQLSINNPDLWWPNGYGDPNLYKCQFTLKVGDEVSDMKEITFGIRDYDYDTEGGVLHISINGKRVFLKGGNWGMSEYMLRTRGEEYDLKVRLHKEMNYNIIRNWLGSTTDAEFYEACDKYGILVWDDFWLNANPNLPSNIHDFNVNSVEKIKRVRNHASVALWCGNNEGYPQPPLNGWLRENIKTFDGDDRYYQARSNTDNLSGSGIWGNKNAKFYFTKYPAAYVGTGDGPSWGLRSEIGTAVFPNIESFKKFMPEDKLWPQNEMWNQHFFGQNAFNATPGYYNETMNTLYGKPDNIEEYCRKAQLINLETNKAMYEGWLANLWEDASGIMIWMSQSAYPSMVWQTYDYYYDMTGAYFGVKTACEPLHILWNPVTNGVLVSNTTSDNFNDLTAEALVYNTDGNEVTKFHKSGKLLSYSNTVSEVFEIPFYTNQSDMALNKNVVASSDGGSNPLNITDGNRDSRWSSEFSDDQWIYVDLESSKNVNRVVLNWENAYGKHYKIQVSDDAKSWKDVAEEKNGKVGIQSVVFDDITARYVRMLGIKRGSGWGYSLYDFKVYGASSDNAGLSSVHFIKLKLTDTRGNLVSENLYWRGTNSKDFTALNKLKEVNLKVSSKVKQDNEKYFIVARITNPSSSGTVAFSVRTKLLNSKSGELILPAIFSDNYFTLMPGESKEISIEFDASLLDKGEKPIIKAEAYNNF